jgi:uncharacterized protein YggE
MGEGNASITPDYAQIETGVSTVKEATDANSKSMAAVTKALLDSGIAQSDIQTSRFSVQPVYAPQEPRADCKLEKRRSRHARHRPARLSAFGASQFT